MGLLSYKPPRYFKGNISMNEFISSVYFVGLVIFAVATGSYTDQPDFGFMIIGGGMVVYALIAAMIKYLHPKG